MRIKLLVAFITCIVSLASANDDFKKIKIITDSSALDLPKVKDDGDNVVITSGGGENLKNTPASSLAYSVADKSKNIEWRPRWHYSGTNGVWIPSIVCSYDKSIIAIVENTGSGSGPKGTRIVLINTYNWKTVRIINFKSQKITNLCFIPNSSYAVCYQEQQKLLEQKENKLILVDLSGEEPDMAIPAPEGGLGSMIGARKFFFIKPDESKNIYKYTCNGKLLMTGKIKFIKGRVCFDVTEDKRTLAIAGKDRLWRYDAFNDIEDNIKVPENYQTTSVAFCGSKNMLAIGAEGRNAIFYDNKSRKEVKGYGTGKVAYDPFGKILFVEKIKRGVLSPYKIPSLKEMRGVSPLRIKPKSKGYIVFMSPLPGEQVVIMNSYGDLMLLKFTQKKGRKRKSRYFWSKSVLITALK